MTLDADTWLKTSGAIKRCHRSGWDPGEELERLGLLLTPARRTAIEVTALTRLLNQLEIWRPAELLRRKYHAGHPATPQDMYLVMLEFIEEFRQATKEGA